MSSASDNAADAVPDQVESGRPLDACRYRAFISYSHADERWARWLHRSLEKWRVPARLAGTVTPAGTLPQRLAPVFRDRDELASAADLGERIRHALEDSATLIVICSPASAASRWVNEEVLAYKRMGRAGRIVCLIVEGEPGASRLPGREDEECFCPALRFTLDASGELSDRPAEPVAADARAGKDGKDNARLKLIAGLLDVGFDALRQREQQRRFRRMAAVTGLALVAMLVTTGLAITAIIARQQADSARQAAERRQKQAENLVGFMLGDLNDKLKGVGRLDIMQAVDDKAMAFFRSLPTADVTDTALAGRATALQKIGNVRADQGHSAEALEAYQAAARIQAERLRRAPDNVDTQIDYAESLNWIGNGYWYLGKLDRAGHAFRMVAATLSGAVKARPDDSDLAFKLAAARNNLGHVLESRGDIGGARTQYEEVLKAFSLLHDRHPHDPSWQMQLAYAHNNLGMLALKQGNLVEAIERFHADLTLKQQLCASDPRNQQWRSALAVSQATLARGLNMAGGTSAATTYAGDAVRLGQALVALDPDNAARRQYLALYRIRLAGLQRQLGQLHAASAQIDDALATMHSLAASNPGDSGWQRDLAKAQLESALIARASTRHGKARQLGEAALATLKPLLAGQADNSTVLLLQARTEMLLGDLDADRAHLPEAHARWRKAQDISAPLARDGRDPDMLAVLAGSLLRLGQRPAVPEILASLRQMGYRDPDFIADLKRARIDYPSDPAIGKRIAALTR